jgi:ATP-dependent Lon protease
MFFKNDNERGTGGRLIEGIVPLLPLRDIIVFPHMVSQLFVGRERSIAALDEAMTGGKRSSLPRSGTRRPTSPRRMTSSSWDRWA